MGDFGFVVNIVVVVMFGFTAVIVELLVDVVGVDVDCVAVVVFALGVGLVTLVNLVESVEIVVVGVTVVVVLVLGVVLVVDWVLTVSVSALMLVFSVVLVVVVVCTAVAEVGIVLVAFTVDFAEVTATDSDEVAVAGILVEPAEAVLLSAKGPCSHHAAF